MKTSIKVLYWLPRFICVLAILFISLFALDSFDPELTIWQQISGFLIHLIPSYILTAILIIAWKWEFIGGIIFAVIGLGTSPFIFLLNHNRNHFSVGQSFGVVMMICFPFLLIGILFIMNHFLKKKSSKSIKLQ